jgi:hypothetical protein
MTPGPLVGSSSAPVWTVHRPRIRADGHAWFHLRAPNGNFYELCEHNRFLESSEG